MMPTAFQQSLDSFLDQLVFVRGLSENTREAYGNDLRAFGDFLAERGIADVESVRRTDIVRFLGKEQSEGFAETTRVRRQNAIRAFFSWLYDEEGLPENPSDALLRPRLWQHLPETLTDLIGLAVYEEDVQIGVVKDVIETDANDVYQIERTDGTELLLPAIRQCVLRVDVEGGRMDVSVMEGL